MKPDSVRIYEPPTRSLPTKTPVYAWISETAVCAHKIERLWKSHASEVDNCVRWRWHGDIHANLGHVRGSVGGLLQ